MKNLMKFVVLVGFIISLHWSVQGQSHDDYYYSSNGEKVFIDIVANKYVIEFPNGANEDLFSQNNIEFNKLDSNYYEINSDILTIQNTFDNYYINPVYAYKEGFEISIKREILLQFKEETSEVEKLSLVDNYGLQLVKKSASFEKYMVNNALQISKEIYLSDLVEFCSPNFFCEIIFCSANETNDEYFEKQFYLHNTGQTVNGISGTEGADINAPEAWEITKGSSDVIVAIVGMGVGDDHPDLPASRQLRLPGSDLYDEDDDPSPEDQFSWSWNNNHHDNALAGIIAATQDNDIGISGVAPECMIMPVRFGSHPYDNNSIDHALVAASIDFAVQNEADIINIGWGFDTWGDPIIPAVEAAILNAIDAGCIVVCSVGNLANDEETPQPILGSIVYPASGNIPGLITVGASDMDDKKANYSSYPHEWLDYTPNSLDIVAPSSHYFMNFEGANVWAIDTPGDLGYNPEGSLYVPSEGSDYAAYTGLMGGTSVSGAITSGCIALALSENPTLSSSQINNLLKFTSDKVHAIDGSGSGLYDYNYNPSFPGHSRKMGYGRLNCYQLVKTASAMYSQNEIDLYMRDQENDFGIEPNDTEEENMWSSPDIWVRNQNDGIENQEHQNPKYGQTNYVYVRVTNNGEFESTGNEQLDLHWAKAAGNLSWPNHWNGSITNPLMGALLEEKIIPVIQSGEEKILTFVWSDIPDPSLYGTENPWHFCLLARIIAPVNDPMSVAEGSSVWMNTYNNNNIAWKNVSVVGDGSFSRNPGGTIAIGNTDTQGGGETQCYDIEFKIPKPYGFPSILDAAEVTITLDDVVYNSWVAGGKQGVNVNDIKNNQVRITGDDAFLRNLCFAPGESGTLFVGFNFLMSISDYAKELFKYQVTQMTTIDHEIIGGELYVVHKPSHSKFKADAGDDKNISKEESIYIDAETIGEDAEYNWYDSKDSLLHTGSTLVVNLDTTTSYKLEVIADVDGYKDYDEVTINVKQYEITSITPNPTSGMVTINYDVENVSSAYILLSNPNNASTETILLDLNQDNYTLDATNLQTGFYGLTLVVNNQIVDQKLLIVQ